MTPRLAETEPETPAKPSHRPPKWWRFVPTLHLPWTMELTTGTWRALRDGAERTDTGRYVWTPGPREP